MGAHCRTQPAPGARVIGVARAGKVRVYPSAALTVKPVINDEVDGQPVVVFALDAEVIRASRRIPAAAAYGRKHGAQVLNFDRREQRMVDRETGSTWDIFGRAIDGPLKGARLTAVDSGVHFAFAWLAFHPQSEVYGSGAIAR